MQGGSSELRGQPSKMPESPSKTLEQCAKCQKALAKRWEHQMKQQGKKIKYKIMVINI